MNLHLTRELERAVAKVCCRLGPADAEAVAAVNDAVRMVARELEEIHEAQRLKYEHYRAKERIAELEALFAEADDPCDLRELSDGDLVLTFGRATAKHVQLQTDAGAASGGSHSLRRNFRHSIAHARLYKAAAEVTLIEIEMVRRAEDADTEGRE